jgi:hypothetical protein
MTTAIDVEMATAGMRLKDAQRALQEAFTAFEKDQGFTLPSDQTYQTQLGEILRTVVSNGTLGNAHSLEALCKAETNDITGEASKHMSVESSRRIKLLGKVLGCLAERDEAWRVLQKELKK